MIGCGFKSISDYFLPLRRVSVDFGLLVFRINLFTANTLFKQRFAAPSQSPLPPLKNGVTMSALRGVQLDPPPKGLEEAHQNLFTTASVLFLAELTTTFQDEVDRILKLRVSRKISLALLGDLPGFSDETSHIRSDETWKVLSVPERLRKRHVDIGDLAPCDTEHFIQGLQSSAQGIQVDFDDGNCPTYYNQIKGIYNVFKAVHNQFPDAPPISEAPVLMLRPRAWNMVEHNMMVNGRQVPGPLFDFGLMMFHCGLQLFKNKSGPFFYLSKIESHIEARLWNNIFLWTENKLGLPVGSIKAIVLIENVLATFEMDEILYELRDHSAGLNCGIWDYSASFVNKFGNNPAFLLPDRSKYVNMEKQFLKCYMDLLVQTCHRRGALATGGMAALLLPKDKNSALYNQVLATVTSVFRNMREAVPLVSSAASMLHMIENLCDCNLRSRDFKKLKLLEIKAGVDGFMVYDMDLIEPMQQLFQQHTKGDNQLNVLRGDLIVTPVQLLTMPAGGVTLYGLKYNIAVGIMFIEAWLRGKGHFFYKGQVEDSATAEISRSQVWQWIRHEARIEDDGREVTSGLVKSLVQEVKDELKEILQISSLRDQQRLLTATSMFLEVVQKNDFPEFLTTYLSQDHTFLVSQEQIEDQDVDGPPRHKL